MIAILGLSINRLLATQTKVLHPSDVSVGHRVSSAASASQANLSTSAQGSVVIMRMVTNEGIAHAQHERFSYISEERSARTDGRLWTEKAVETDDGVLRRLLAVDHLPLTFAARKAEERRIEDLVAHPQTFRKLNEGHKEDVTHAIQLLQMLPKAFLISSDGEQQGCTRFAFRPNPSFQPSTYEERIVHVLEGTVSVKEPEDRLADAAVLLHCSKAHICKAVSGRVPECPPIPAVSLGRRKLIRRESLRQWIEANERISADDRLTRLPERDAGERG